MENKTGTLRTFSFLLITLSVYFLAWQSLSLCFDLPPYYYARLIEFLAILLFIALALSTPMRFSKMGIAVPRAVLLRSLAAGGLLSLAVCLLLIPIAAASGHTPLFSLAINGDISRATYILVAPLQEVLSKSVMYYSFELCFEEKHPHLTNALCALVFGIFHVVYGLPMMLLSMALSLLTGWLFQKNRCVWGCAIAHFSLGFLPGCFGL